MIDLEAANHTNSELELMLAGRKPLAMFYAEISELPDECLIPEEAFGAFVAVGKFARAEIDCEADFDPRIGRNIVIRYVFFAVSGEEWRLRAMTLLKKSQSRSHCAWNETLERMESELLGYSDEEIDAWCDKRYRTPRE